MKKLLECEFKANKQLAAPAESASATKTNNFAENNEHLGIIEQKKQKKYTI